MQVSLISHTPNPEKIIAAAARLCYSDTEADELLLNMSEEKANQLVNMLDGFGHESPIEHVTFTFSISGVSRSLLAQITRHRIASFSVQSQRYVKQDKFIYITPPAISQNPEANKIYQKAMQDSIDTYNKLADKLQSQYYPEFLSQGLSEKSARSKSEKKAIEDARYVLPNACETKMIMTMNVRSLKNFFRLRCCNRAQWEIRELAMEMLKLCYNVSPILFKSAGPSCYCGACSEGKMTCGQAEPVRKKFGEIKNDR